MVTIIRAFTYEMICTVRSYGSCFLLKTGLYDLRIYPRELKLVIDYMLFSNIIIIHGIEDSRILRSGPGELHKQLYKSIKQGGKIGEAAKAVADILHLHFEKEEEYVLPPLGLLLSPLVPGS